MKLSTILKSIGGTLKTNMGNYKEFSFRKGISYKFMKILFFYCRNVGYIPSNYVKEKNLLGLQKYEYAFLFFLFPNAM